MRRELIDESREKPHNLKTGGLHGFSYLIGGVLADVTDFRLFSWHWTFVEKKDLGIIVAVERLRDTRYAADVRSRNEKKASVDLTPDEPPAACASDRT